MKFFAHTNPSDIISLFFSCLKSILSHSNDLCKRIFKLDVWVIENSQGRRKGFNLLFIGDKPDMKYFADLMFNQHSHVTYIGKLWLWSIFLMFWRSKSTYDIVIWPNKFKVGHFFTSKTIFLVPVWVECEIDLCRDIVSNSLSKKNVKQFKNRIRKSGLYYTISKDPNIFENFYHNMYLPYVNKRYGHVLINIKYKVLKHNFDKGELLLIREGDNIIAGGILNYSIMKGHPRGTQLGVHMGDFDFVKKGALLAYYYYSIIYLKSKGYKRFYLGPARPFFKDGVLRHKLVWSAQLSHKRYNEHMVCLLSRNKFLSDFLVKNPFLCIDNKRLCLSIFKDDKSELSKCLQISNKSLRKHGIYGKKINSF